MIKPGLTVSFKAEMARGLHHEDDRFMLALYGADAKLDCYTTSYTPKGEVSGQGYRAGGIALKNYEVVEDGEAVVLTWDDVSLEKATLHGVYGGMIYNASKGNRSVGMVALEQPLSSTNGAFDIGFPPATAAEGLFVIE